MPDAEGGYGGSFHQRLARVLMAAAVLEGRAGGSVIVQMRD